MNRLLLFLAVFFEIALAFLMQGSEVHFYCANLTDVFTSAIGKWFSTLGITSVIHMVFFASSTAIMCSLFFFIFKFFRYKPILRSHSPVVSFEKDDADFFCNKGVFNSGFSASKGTFFEVCIAWFYLLDIVVRGVQQTVRKFLSVWVSSTGFGDRTSNPDLIVRYSSYPVGFFCSKLINNKLTIIR